MDVKEFIENERERYGKAFVDINYAIDSISPFLDESNLNKRKYVVKQKILDTYMDMLDKAETSSSSKKKGLFSIFKSDDSLDDINKYKRDNIDTLNKLKNCSRCKCLNCVNECNFNPCKYCRSDSRIVFCDHERYNVSFYDNYILDLTNNDTGKNNKYTVLATVADSVSDNKYILIQNVMDKDDKFILYLYQNISGDEYGEITNEDEFNTIASLYDSIEV